MKTKKSDKEKDEYKEIQKHKDGEEEEDEEEVIDLKDDECEHIKHYKENGWKVTLCHVILQAAGIAFSFWLWHYDGSVDHKEYPGWKADIIRHQPKIKAYKILKEKTLYDASVIAAPFGIYYGIIIAKWLGLSNVKRVNRLRIKKSEAMCYFW